jgi:hypothetical protein
MQPVGTAVAIMMVFFGATLNPDGSGKASIEIVQTVGSPAAGPGDKAAPSAEEVRRVVERVLDRSQGVGAWSSVTATARSNGVVLVTGTAYFKDLAKVRISSPTPMEPTLAWAADSKGGMVLSVDPSRGLPPSSAAPRDLTEAQVAEKVKAYQEIWRSLREQAKAKVSGTSFKVTFKLPGPAADVSGFTKESDGALGFLVDGKKLFAASDELVGDAAYVGRCIKAGVKPADDLRDPTLIEKFLGSKGPWTARVTGEMKPQFDYAAEVKAAKEAYPAMLKSLGLEMLPGKADAGEAVKKAKAATPAAP